uniref:Putative Sodium channel toxin n=1 Tax=Megacormus gertschi TaxID=1843536 RepID=A0A224XBU0_9SCOR
MNAKLTALLFLALVVTASCGWINEKKVQDYLDKKLPNGIVKGAIKAVVHKVAKTEYGCAFNVGVAPSQCNDHCKSLGKKKGVCHGTKCKCDVELSYK